MDPLTLLLVAKGVEGLSSIFSGMQQSSAQRAQGEFENSRYQFNAQLSEIQAEDAILRGEESAQDLSIKGKAFQGRQRAALGSQGIALGRGSAAAIQESTAEAIGRDVSKLRANAWREAWGHRVQAFDSRERGRAALSGAKTSADASLMTGGLQAARAALEGGYYASGGK